MEVQMDKDLFQEEATGTASIKQVSMSVEVTENPQSSYIWEIGRTRAYHTLKLKHNQHSNKPPEHILQLSAKGSQTHCWETSGTPGSNPSVAFYNKGQPYNKGESNVFNLTVNCLQKGLKEDGGLLKQMAALQSKLAVEEDNIPQLFQNPEKSRFHTNLENNKPARYTFVLFSYQ